jgi:O-antigen ligase
MALKITSRFFVNIPKIVASICAVLLGFSIPVSTGLDSILLILLLFTALIGWNSQYLHIITQNPVAKAALLLFGVLLIGCFYGISQPNEGIKTLGKYDDLILVLLTLPIFSQARLRLYGQYAFMGAMLLTLWLSYMIWLGAFQHTPLFTNRLPDNPVVFKLHITHGILMGFAAFMFVVYAKYRDGKVRWLLSIAAILATINVLFMTQGRTGYLVIIALTIYLLFTFFSWRYLILALTILVTGSFGIYQNSSKLHARVTIAVQEIQQWQPMQGKNEASSLGTRMDYYTNTVKIIRKNPLFGVGTGGFEKAYNKEILGSSVASSNNPHNQFLLFWAQTGLIGLCAFLFLIFIAWQNALKLNSIEKMLVQGLLITITIGSLFNSLLLDHTEGLFFSWLLGLLFAGLPSNQENN